MEHLYCLACNDSSGYLTRDAAIAARNGAAVIPSDASDERWTSWKAGIACTRYRIPGGVTLPVVREESLQRATLRLADRRTRLTEHVGRPSSYTAELVAAGSNDAGCRQQAEFGPEASLIARGEPSVRVQQRPSRTDGA